MFQFSKFPIYVVYSKNWQKNLRRLWDSYSTDVWLARRSVSDNLLKMKISNLIRDSKRVHDGKRLILALREFELEEDIKPKYASEILAYENEIRQLLILISSTRIGQLLLNSLNQRSKIWIIPSLGPSHLAMTHPALSSEYDGIRIFFNPDGFHNTFVSPTATADAREEVLFHELVHASRFSNARFLPKPFTNESNFHNSEEFLAEQLANVYHSTRQKSKIYGLYNGGYASKDEAYKMFIENAEYIMALKYLLQTEPLVRQVAALKTPDYNPFRDYQKLEKESLKHHGIDSFLDF